MAWIERRATSYRVRYRLVDGTVGTDSSHPTRGAAELRTRAGGAQLWFDETFRYLQVFTLDDLIDGRPAVALEPMTCAPDAFNTGRGLIVLDPGGVWQGSWGIVPT